MVTGPLTRFEYILYNIIFSVTIVLMASGIYQAGHNILAIVLICLLIFIVYYGFQILSFTETNYEKSEQEIMEKLKLFMEELVRINGTEKIAEKLKACNTSQKILFKADQIYYYLSFEKAKEKEAEINKNNESVAFQMKCSSGWEHIPKQKDWLLDIYCVSEFKK